MINIFCENCKHLTYDLKCLAFPDGIPDFILSDEKKHSEIVYGQSGDYVFESSGRNNKHLSIKDETGLPI